ncbi:ABC transporter ATP-binding protein [Kocuria dechangensis]|uniref:ABC transporter ATP-binding protein n=1 Tax=Kocuria dechangensis TaxID=1176249 RepID=A0A917GKK7_9MICC|nr:ABC transporter ATP-binding protein [Kocuria dechangensis]GGG49182.1 ABC transporter ATP-binding protein [Kocuria dechangensis]
MPEGLVVEHLHVSHRAPEAAPGSGTGSAGGRGGHPILSGVDLAVAPGEFVALVGASGSGKTMTAMSVLGLLPPQVHLDGGTIRLGGTDLARARETELNRVRGGRIGMLYQQPKRMFNPRRTVGSHLREPLKLHGGLRGARAGARALELLAEVGFEDPRWCARAHPHQLSGGMAQRAMVALALAGRPELLLADEPTSALDTVLERQILELIDRERRDRGVGILYITHNLATVSAYADRVMVMDTGHIVESGPAGAVLNAPQSACTKALLDAAALNPARTAPSATEARPVVVLDSITKRFPSNGREARPAVDQVSLDLREGEILGVLGQSGSGKSTLARLIVGLETPDSGRITGTLGADADGTGAAGSHVQLVFQDPHDSFDPRMRLRTSLEAPLLRRRDTTSEQRRMRIHEVVQEVGLDPGLLDGFPGQCSGGQLQRLTIARALLLEPTVLICDEATSALDAVTQRTVLDLLLRLHRNRRLSLVMISHDLSVIRYMSHRVAVLFQGRLVELAETEDLFTGPRHEHSKQLVAAALPRVCAILDAHRLPQEQVDALP